MPTISVITPVYNKEKYIANAIESVLNQTYGDFEYIIIDDGSTDNSPAIVDYYAKKDSRIKVVHQHNQWIYASFNNGISCASGQYVYILNADDKLRKNALEILIQIVEEFKPDVIWTKVLCHKADNNQNIIEYDYRKLDGRVTNDEIIKSNVELAENWARLFAAYYVINQANLYKRELAIKYPFRNDVYAADTFFNINLASHLHSTYVCSQPIYDFFEYDNGENASRGYYYEYEHEMFDELYLENIKLLKKIGITDKDTYMFFARTRLSDFSYELRQYKYCKIFSSEQIVERIIAHYSSDVLQKCADEINGHAELERRLLYGINELIEVGIIHPSPKYQYLVEILDMIEKQNDLCKKLQATIQQDDNEYGVGKYFLKELQDGNIFYYLKYYFGG